MRDRRIEMLHHPVTIVRAALDPAAKITNLRQQGRRTARRRHDGQRRHAHAGDRRFDEAADARHVDERQRQPGRRRDRDVVFRLRGRERAEAAEALDDEHRQVPAVRPAGLEEHGRWRRRRSGGARCREGRRASAARRDRRHRRTGRQGHLVAGRLGQPSQRRLRVRRPSRAVRGAAERSAVEGGHRQGEVAQREAADARDRLASSFRSFRRAARRGGRRADDHHLPRQRGVLQRPARAQAYDRARRSSRRVRRPRSSSSWTTS